MTAFTDADADALRDAAGVLRNRALNPRLIPQQQTHLAVTAAGLEREADKIDQENRVAAARPAQVTDL
jgi:hypothetical protein